MTLRVESFRSGSHMTTVIQNFTLVSLTSITISHWVWLQFGTSGLFLDLCTQLLLTLHIQPFTVYATELARHIYGMIHSSIIYKLSTCRGIRLNHPQTSLSGEEWPVGWTQPDLFPCAVVSLVIMTKVWHQQSQARWHRSLGVTRDDRTWRMYTSGTVLERLRAQQGWTALEPQIRTRQGWTVLTTQQG